MKKIIALSALAVVLGAGLLKSGIVFAQGNGQERMSTLVQKIADKFNLNKDEVQAIFDEDKAIRETEMKAEREARRAEMQTKYEERLTQDVTYGKITEEQRKLILAKHKEMEANRETKMEGNRTELEAWAKENGIDSSYLMGGFGGRGRGGMGGFGK